MLLLSQDLQTINSTFDPIFNKAVFTGISKVDTTAPKATKIESLGIDKVVFYFSEAMKASITDISNYSIDENYLLKKLKQMFLEIK